MDTSLCHRLSCDAGQIIDSTGIKCIVGIGHPGHFPFARADVGSRNVLSGSQIFFADQFGGESAGNFLYLFVAVFLRIETHAALRPAKGYVDNRAFVRHQGGQGHDLVLVYVFAETNAAFDRLFMLAVFGTPALEYLVFVAAESDGELKIVNVVAGLDLAYKGRMNFQILRCTIELLRDNSVEVEIFLRCKRSRHSVSLNPFPPLQGEKQIVLTFESVYPRIRPK